MTCFLAILQGAKKGGQVRFKNIFRCVAFSLFLFFPALGAAGLYQIRGSGNGAIDTLTISGSFLNRPNSNSPLAVEYVIFRTASGSTPDQTRDSVVAAAGGLTNFVITAAGPGTFSVDTYPSPGGSFDVLLDGQLITTDGDGVTAHSGQNFIQLPSQIPALSEWGLILFAALFLASLVWYALRRRKPARAES